MQTDAQVSQWDLQQITARVSDYYNSVANNSEARKMVLSATRSTIGIAAVSFTPGPAVLGVGLGVTMPKFTQTTCDLADGALTGVWNKMGFGAKLGSAALGIGLLSLGVNFSLISFPSSIFALKIGAELGIVNYHKQAP